MKKLLILLLALGAVGFGAASAHATCFATDHLICQDTNPEVNLARAPIYEFVSASCSAPGGPVRVSHTLSKRHPSGEYGFSLSMPPLETSGAGARVSYLSVNDDGQPGYALFYVHEGQALIDIALPRDHLLNTGGPLRSYRCEAQSPVGRPGPVLRPRPRPLPEPEN